MIILTRPISAQYFNALYQVELISILYIAHTNNSFLYSFVNKLISMFYIKNTDSALTPYMIAHLQQTANIPSWVWSYSKADKEWKLVFHAYGYALLVFYLMLGNLYPIDYSFSFFIPYIIYTRSQGVRV